MAGASKTQPQLPPRRRYNEKEGRAAESHHGTFPEGRRPFLQGEERLMPEPARPSTLKALRDSGWTSKTVKQEIRDNFLTLLRSGEDLFPGIIGYDNTVIPEINLALIAGHDQLYLGEKGQAKSRLMRALVRFLDEELPYLDLPGSPVHEDPYRPITRAGKELGPGRPRRRSPSPGGRASSATPSGWRPAPSSPTSSARSTRPSWRRAPACPPRRRCTSA